MNEKIYFFRPSPLGGKGSLFHSFFNLVISFLTIYTKFFTHPIYTLTNYLIIFLIITTLSSCCLYFSWKYYKSAKYTFAVLFIIFCGLSLRIFTGSDGFLHEWDERYHALVAKNLLTNPTIPTLYGNPVLPFDYRDWTANNVWVHKQPVPLYTISLSLLIFGINEISVRIPSIIFSTLGIWLTFYIGAFFFNKKIGFLSAFFYSINGLIIELSAGRVATDHIDIFFLFFVQLSIYLTIKYIETKSFIFNILSALSLGFGILSKWLPALIVLPIWCLLVINSGKFSIRKTAYDFIGFIIVVAIVVIPWQIYINSFFPVESKWEASFNLKHITEVLDNQGGPVYYYLNKIRINYGELIYLPIIYFLIKFFSKILKI